VSSNIFISENLRGKIPNFAVVDNTDSLILRENISNDLYKPAIMKLEVYNLLPILKQDNCVIEGFSPKFERLLNLNFLSDLKIVVKESKKSEREIFCHKMILCARSSYFRTMYHVSSDKLNVLDPSFALHFYTQ
jgi:hypothetical protein